MGVWVGGPWGAGWRRKGTGPCVFLGEATAGTSCSQWWLSHDHGILSVYCVLTLVLCVVVRLVCVDTVVLLFSLYVRARAGISVCCPSHSFISMTAATFVCISVWTKRTSLMHPTGVACRPRASFPPWPSLCLPGRSPIPSYMLPLDTWGERGLGGSEGVPESRGDAV